MVAVDAEEEVELSLSGDGEVDGVEGMVAESEGMLIISVSRMSVFVWKWCWLGTSLWGSLLSSMESC